jgi:hypothetical protein
MPGTVVTITGKNFDTTPANNAVKFSNVAATVRAGTETSLTVTVPAGASTGKIEVTAGGKSKESATDFVVPPVITDFSPKFGRAGSNITIIGTGFSSTAGNNIVKVGGVTATVSAASSTSLTVQMPAAGFSGVISLEIGSSSVTTTEVFKYIPVIDSFDPIYGPATATITITGSGFNKVLAGNTVKIGDLSAQVISGTSTQLVVKGGPETKTGLISVESEGFMITSVVPYTVIVEAWSAGGAKFDVGYSIGVDAAGN